MKISGYCIKNSIIAYSLALVLIVAGVFCFFKLSVNALPKFQVMDASIITNYSGGSPQFMEDAITTKIEDAIRGTKGVDSVRSFSAVGESHVHITFLPGADVNSVISNLQNEVAMIRSKLPHNATQPSIQIDDDSNSNTIMYIGVFSKDATQAALSTYARDHVMNILRNVPGVGELSIEHENDYAVRIWLHPKQLSQYGVTTNEVATALDAANLPASGGSINNNDQGFPLQVSGKPDTLSRLGEVIIKRIDQDTVVRVKDVATVMLGPNNITNISLINGMPGFVVDVLPQSGANNIIVAKRVSSVIASLQDKLPPNLQVKVLLDRSRYIQDATNEVYKAIILAIILVSLVVFVFLGSFRLFIIPIVIVPICLIAGFAIIYCFGFTINIMTLLAIVLSIGLIVDDAIVVLENVMRHFHRLKDRVKASYYGAKEIGFAVIAMTCTLVVVYLPIVLIHGFTGDLIRPFAYTLAALVVLSGILSLTLTPTMCSRVLTEKALQNNYMHWLDSHFSKLQQGYLVLLKRVLKHRVVTILACLVFVIIGLYCFSHLKSELLPPEDYGKFKVSIGIPYNSSPQYLHRQTYKLSALLQGVPQMKYVLANDDYKEGSVDVTAILVPPNKRKQDTDQVMQKVNTMAAKKDATDLINTRSLALFGAADDSRAVSMAVSFNGSYRKLNDIMQRLVKAARRYKGFSFVQSDLNFQSQQINININRRLAMDLGVPLSSISESISTLYGGYQAENDYTVMGVDYPIVLMLPAKDRVNLDRLDKLYVKSLTTGILIRLSNLVTEKNVVAPAVLSHYNFLPAARLQASVAPGYTTGEVIKKLESIAQQNLPHNVQYAWTGPSKRFIEASGNMEMLTIVALVAIFLVLTIQFKSFYDPFIILLTIPLTFIGSAIVLYLAHGTLNIYTRVGLLTLIGLITKHGILITDFANILRKEGRSIADSITHAATMRLKPVLMTSLAMILGSLPLALSSGEGSHAMQEIGWVLVGGLFFGTIFSLFVVPIAYSYLSKLRKVEEEIVL
ncbi:MAG: efflux RND transporter permease subunit [Gammaproteobacteria bacterium]|nr:efflux RND transporter permease subunit [Gammaproteobacteria bacterium]